MSFQHKSNLVKIVPIIARGNSILNFDRDADPGKLSSLVVLLKNIEHQNKRREILEMHR